MKKRTFIIEDYRNKLTNSLKEHTPFRVKELVNTVRFEIGEFLSKSTVENLCLDPDNTVKIIKGK